MRPIRYLDVCSGYSAFTQGAIGLPFECAGYAEIDAFPSALLGHHYGATRARYMPDPDAPCIDAKERKTRIALRKSMAALSDSHFGNRIVNFGDFTQIREDDVGPVDWLVGGTPCQAFSIAGKRLGLDDPRGNLTLEFLALAKRVRAYGVAWENVPGFLSHDGGRTMGTFLRLLGECGYGFAWRVLDAQYIRVDGLSRAVPQRRKRLIVVGCLGDPARAAAILFERESLCGDTAPRREAGEGVAGTLTPGAHPGSYNGQDAYDDKLIVAHSLRADGFDASEDGTGRGTPLVPVAFNLRGRDGEPQAEAAPDGLAPSLRTNGGGSSHTFLAQGWAVRRLTPKECERLMGLEDHFTAIPYRGKLAADGPRYKALGNSQTRNMMRWIAHGIAMTEPAKEAQAA